jgi:hypothetical protein
MPDPTPTEEIVLPVEGEAPPETKAEGEETPPGPSIFDAVDEALKPVTHEAKPDDGDEKAGEKPADDEADADKHVMKADGTPERDAKGRFIPKNKDETPPEGEKKPAETKPKGKADAVNDPIDPSLSERTRERITTLATRVKDAEKQVADNEAIFKHIADTGASPDQFAQTVGFLRLYHSKDPGDNKRAYEALKVEVKYLATKLGITDDVAVDFLSDFPDLKNQVAAGKLDVKVARELALTRTRAKNEEAQRATTEAAEKQTRDLATAKQGAIEELNGIGVELSKDPEYAAKYAILVPQLRPVFEGLHPSLWGSTFRRAYAGLKLPAGTTTTIRQQPTGSEEKPAVKQQPMRGNKGVPASGAKKQPGSMLEAISNALDG